MLRVEGVPGSILDSEVLRYFAYGSHGFVYALYVNTGM
jgi:hypothetical protein